MIKTPISADLCTLGLNKAIICRLTVALCVCYGFFRQASALPLLVIGFGFAILVVGIWHGMFTARKRGPLFGLLCGALVLSGWLICVFNDVIIYFTENAAASFGISGVSAPRYRGAEYVGVIPIVVPELELCNVQRQVFAADLVEAAHNTAASGGGGGAFRSAAPATMTLPDPSPPRPPLRLSQCLFLSFPPT